MNNKMLRTLLMLLLLQAVTTSLAGDAGEDYEPTVAVITKALKGWQLYRNEKFVASFRNGHYTDTDSETPGFDFWSDGHVAKLDREGDGQHETYFTVVSQKLVYVGSIGRKGAFVHTAAKFKKHLGQPIESFMRDIKRPRANQPIDQPESACFPIVRSCVPQPTWRLVQDGCRWICQPGCQDNRYFSTSSSRIGRCR